MLYKLRLLKEYELTQLIVTEYLCMSDKLMMKARNVVDICVCGDTININEISLLQNS